MSKVIEFFKTPWVIQLLGLIALSLVIWFVGPLIAIAGAVPLDSETARWLVIGVLFTCWTGYRLWRLLRSIRRERELLAGLKQVDTQAVAHEALQSEKSEEFEILRKGFDEALEVLKQTRTGKGGRRQALYEMPWYAIIGAPGSGKTTALINSGLRFPLAEKLGKHSVKGVSGTRNCDWWFSDEAVLLDTAGRYTTQDSHQPIDSAAWEGFLRLLKNYRPRRPLNGILVAVSASDLLRQTEEERRLHAAAIRQRVNELYQVLGVRLPVYTLFTKCDLVAGFTDFFAELSTEERCQVWGETFPHVANRDDSADEALKCFWTGFDELQQRLQQRLYRRLHDERDLQRRTSILDFPQQMAMLKPLMAEFLRLAFSANRYESSPVIRGVYLTSGTQEGTPIDRVMGMLAQTFRLDRQSLPVFSGKGKSFFLTRLIREVIFPEAELVGVDPKVERRWRWLQIGAYGATLAFSLAAIVLWMVSYQRNQSAIAAVQSQIDRYHAVNLVPHDTKSNFEALLPRLNALKAAREVYADPGWGMGLGLYQGDKLATGIDSAYENLLEGKFALAITQRLRERMQGEEANNPEVLYQLLRVYLMFGEPERMDPKIVELWIAQDWGHLFATDPDALTKLNSHLAYLIGLPGRKVPLDDVFVSAVREKLTRDPIENQIYNQVKSEAMMGPGQDFRLMTALPPTAARVFIGSKGEDIDNLKVPYFFTVAGYRDFFLKDSLNAVKQAIGQNWVLGEQHKLDPADEIQMHTHLKKLYLADYQLAWDKLLAGIEVRSPRSPEQTVEILDLIARNDTALKALLVAVAKNTELSKLASSFAQPLAKAGAATGTMPDANTKKLLEAASDAYRADTGMDPAMAVEQHFEPFNKLVRGGGPDKPVLLDTTLSKAAELRDYVIQSRGGAGAGGNMGLDAVKQAEMEFGRLPDPVRRWLLSLARAASGQVGGETKAKLNAEVKAAVATPCREILQGRYPFVRGSSQDVLPGDFAKLFASGGIVDQFFQTKLRPFVDTTKSEWRELSSDKPLGLSAASIRQFQRASRIKDAFFGMNAGVPQIQFELKPLSLDNTVSTFRFNVEGQEALYRHGPDQWTKFQWPGPTPNAGVRMVFETLDGRQVSRAKEGPWALFRMLDELTVQSSGAPDRFSVSFQADGFTARYELRAGSVNNPFSSGELQNFRCPEGL